MSILGTRVVRTEDPGFLTTGAVYTDDVVDERLAGAGHVFFVRSPIAHARITAVNTSAALQAPGVIAVFTGADLADLAPLRPPMPDLVNGRMAQPLLARDVVRYVGEPVAVVVTEDPYQGEDAAELVSADYDPLPAVVDMTAAADDPPALLFPEAGTNVTATFGDAAALRPDLFDGCEVVVSRTIVNQRVAPAPMETRAAAAAWGDEWPAHGLDPEPGRPGHQGCPGRHAGPGPVQPADHHPGRGRCVRRQVRRGPGARRGVLGGPATRQARALVRDPHREHGRDDTRPGPAPDDHHRRRAGRDGDRLPAGDPAGLRGLPRFGAFLPALTILMAPGPYAIGRAEAVARSVVTSTTPVGAYRGAGRPEATAAVERAIDLFAAEIGRDPAEVRRKNLLPRFTEPHRTAFGAVYDSGDYVTALDAALAAAGYASLREEQARRRDAGDVIQLGIGLASYVEITGGGAESGAPGRTPPSKYTPTAARRSSPGHPRTARATPPCGPCWPARSWASRWTGSR